MENFIQSACDARLIPGAVVFATDRTGRLDYRNVFGSHSLEDPTTYTPLAFDSTVWFASCTKLITSIAAMQCVERGLVSLDEDVRALAPELDDLEVLRGGENGTIASRTKNTTPITLRQLLSHSSGFAYEFNSPTLQAWRNETPESERPTPTSVRKRFLHPLLYEPGTSWSYGPSTDWAGVVVERVTGSTLQDYIVKNIFDPLDIKNLTFFLATRPDLQAKRAVMSWRTEEAEAVHSQHKQPCFEPDFEDASGGGGIFGAPGEYMKVLCALLLATGQSASDAESYPPAQLLRRSTANALFEPQLGENGRKALQGVSEIPRLNEMLGGMPPKTRKDWGLGGLVVLDDLPGWRNKGTLTWGGTPNLTWWIDRTAGICGLYSSQIMPIGDAKSNEMVHAFEKDMYRRLAELNKGSERVDSPLDG
ncbi:beta-lactamase/transpeptidase-like protein [Myriangium duriaei CBS 260.36]|uniref:Beta-lactamase/transpeptidase-like protein n=1 Tax=Myriangium duriaei CBS 260.36 TaxID=1168546 RepID=A0A9P4J5D8_9PEZI|nr:beta-lactamase/transpeptidase-like protein [Myriangium duriaei CBS 260.36]